LIPRFLRFLVSHAFFAATCAVFLCFQTDLLLGISTDPRLLLFIFCATVAAYNFHYCTGLGHRCRWKLKLRDWSHLSHFRLFLLFSLLTILFFLSFGLPVIPLIFSVFLTLSYSVPLLPLGVAVKLRKFGFVKTALLAFAWAWVTVTLPVAGAAVKIQLPVTALVFLQRFLFVFILCLIFDERDSESDTLAGIHSLATAYSRAIIRRILFGAAGILFLFNCLMGPFVGSRQLLAMQVTLLVTCVVCFLSTNRKGFLFYYVLVDGLMIFSASMCFLAAKCVNLH
jgi:hypothetical protein